ncbi:unnamed protein product [Urochloa decumbens]|uniref:MATH domain-containing protein n=1 Tax=Urochloa decumbens TaxID=240449 RepID=A0ABC9GFV5_9POAL
MASTTAALMTAAARRLSRSTASAMVLRDVSGSHKLTIDGCASSMDVTKGWAWFSRSFDVGGHSWRIRYTPHEDGDISLHLMLDDPRTSKDARTGSVKSIKFSVLDQSGNPVPEFTRTVTGPCAFDCWSRFHGFSGFIKWKDLEKLGCLKDDIFTVTVQCDLTVTADLAELGVAYDHEDGAAPASAGDGDGGLTSSSVSVARRRSTRTGGSSPSAPRASKPSCAGRRLELEDVQRRHIEIKDMEPKVFEAVLYYMYTNVLPETMEDGGEHDAMMAMAKGLLAAADRFKMEGLKLKCEEALSRRIDVGTAARTLAVAEQHGCKALKAACLEFMARPEDLKAVMETEGYEKAKAIVCPLVVELVMKKWLASAAATKCVN